jgi:glycosyltransferase involved in cell wall biosynthesis
MMGTPVAAYDVTGPKDIIVNGVNGCINDDIEEAIRGAYTVDRFHCLEYTRNMYSWESVWHVFRDNMVRV